MRSLIIVLVFLLSLTSAFSQPICGFDKVHERKLETVPLYKKAVEENEKNVQEYIRKNRSILTARTTGTNAVLYTIPVVVHVMHTGGAVGSIYNPTDAQILGAIDYLNQVYSGTYPGTQGIGDLQLQFALATRDPNCNSTTGIERIDASSVTGYATNGVSSDPGNTPGVDETLIKGMSVWNTAQYYNVWVVNKIDGNDGTSGTFIAGYAYPPGAPSPIDGIIMLATQMSSGAKTLPHEIGHAFGLYHTFEGSPDQNTCPDNTSCSLNGDRVCDTDPETYNQLGGVFDFSCRSGINPCTGTAYTINTESNYMNYTNCYTLFTAGQKARMLANAAGPYRKSLSTSLALSPSYPIASYSSPIAPACVPATSATGLSDTYAGIINVEVNNRDLGSSFAIYDNGYLDGTTGCLNLIQLVRGTTYTFTATVAGVNDEQIRAWIDYNNDGIFDNATEQVIFQDNILTNSPVATANFTVPLTVPLNTMVRMRVIDEVSAASYGFPSISDGCFNPTYGQAEDYPVYLTSGTLPVTLSSFTGVLRDNAAVLFWTTTMEQNLQDFEIEKSKDGITYTKIASVKAGKQGTSLHQYSYTDFNLSDKNYYRLQINDVNDIHKFSGVVLIRYSGQKENWSVVNNPFDNYIEMHFNKAGSKARLQLINTLGAVVAEKTMTTVLGQVRWELPPNLGRGNYIIKAVIDNEQFTTKLVKQ